MWTDVNTMLYIIYQGGRVFESLAKNDFKLEKKWKYFHMYALGT